MLTYKIKALDTSEEYQEIELMNVYASPDGLLISGETLASYCLEDGQLAYIYDDNDPTMKEVYLNVTNVLQQGYVLVNTQFLVQQENELKYFVDDYGNYYLENTEMISDYEDNGENYIAYLNTFTYEGKDYEIEFHDTSSTTLSEVDEEGIDGDNYSYSSVTIPVKHYIYNNYVDINGTEYYVDFSNENAYVEVENGNAYFAHDYSISNWKRISQVVIEQNGFPRVDVTEVHCMKEYRTISLDGKNLVDLTRYKDLAIGDSSYLRGETDELSEEQLAMWNEVQAKTNQTSWDANPKMWYCYTTLSDAQDDINLSGFCSSFEDEITLYNADIEEMKTVSYTDADGETGTYQIRSGLTFPITYSWKSVSDSDDCLSFYFKETEFDFQVGDTIKVVSKELVTQQCELYHSDVFNKDYIEFSGDIYYVQDNKKDFVVIEGDEYFLYDYKSIIHQTNLDDVDEEIQKYLTSHNMTSYTTEIKYCIIDDKRNYFEIEDIYSSVTFSSDEIETVNGVSYEKASLTATYEYYDWDDEEVQSGEKTISDIKSVTYSVNDNSYQADTSSIKITSIGKQAVKYFSSSYIMDSGGTIDTYQPYETDGTGENIYELDENGNMKYDDSGNVIQPTGEDGNPLTDGTGAYIYDEVGRIKFKEESIYSIISKKCVYIQSKYFFVEESVLSQTYLDDSDEDVNDESTTETVTVYDCYENYNYIIDEINGQNILRCHLQSTAPFGVNYKIRINFKNYDVYFIDNLFKKSTLDDLMIGKERTKLHLLLSSSFFSIPIALTNDMSVNLHHEDVVNEQLYNQEVAKGINRIVDMERDVYTPCVYERQVIDSEIVKSFVSLVREIQFHPHFRVRDDNWKVIEDYNLAPTEEGEATYSTWNVFDKYQKEGYFKIFSLSGNTSYHPSDLLYFLKFDDDDVYMQKTKIKKTFLRLSFYDSKDPMNQSLLYTSTVFLDSNKLYSKYIKNSNGENEFFSMKNGKEQQIHFITVDSEPYYCRASSSITQFESEKLEEQRLDCTFSVKNRIESSNSCEGFYIHLFKEYTNYTHDRVIYMKVEFNHAGQGKHVNMFNLALVPKTDINDYKKFMTEGIPIKEIYDYMYMPLHVVYDADLHQYHYYFDDVDIINNVLHFDLFELKIKDES